METGPCNHLIGHYTITLAQPITHFARNRLRRCDGILFKLKHTVASWAGNNQRIAERKHPLLLTSFAIHCLAKSFRFFLPNAKHIGFSNWKQGDGYQYCLTKAKAFVRLMLTTAQFAKANSAEMLFASL